jgi:hypothetical protein
VYVSLFASVTIILIVPEVPAVVGVPVILLDTPLNISPVGIVPVEIEYVYV